MAKFTPEDRQNRHSRNSIWRHFEKHAPFGIDGVVGLHVSTVIRLVLVRVVIAGAFGMCAATDQRVLIPGIGPIGNVELVCTGFSVAEGPVCDAAGTLYFSDIHSGNGRIYRLDNAGQLTLFIDGTDKANGLAFNAGGELLACQMSGRVVAFAPDGRSSRVLADNYCGARFNAPNDLAIDRCGGVWFTDPTFGCGLFAPHPWRRGVYYISPDGNLTRVIDQLPNPNGVVLSPDESTLYVVCTFHKHVLAYPVLAPGKIGSGRVFCRMQRTALPIYVGGDGAAVDAAGNLYVASHRGIQVFDPTGAPLGIIGVPECPTNVAFGGPDRRTLYITAWRSLYRARMLVPGL